MSNHLRRLVGVFTYLALCPGPAAADTVVGNFTGGDPGEGLALQTDSGSSFAYAVRFTSEPGPATRTVDGVPFVREVDEPGVTVSGPNVVQSNNWGAQPAYGDTPNDSSLEEIMWDIYFGGSESSLEIDLDIEPRTPYKLQLLFSENFYTSADRSFDVVIQGVTEVEDLNVYALGGGSKDPDPDAGVALTHEFFSGTDTTLSVELRNTGNTNDTTPIISALTLEQVPEPSTWVLAVVAMALLAVRPGKGAKRKARLPVAARPRAEARSPRGRPPQEGRSHESGNTPANVKRASV